MDVVHFTGETWLYRSGNFHSPSLHVIERYTRTGPDHMLYEVTIDDPEVYTEPWQMSMPLYRRLESDVRVLEYEGYELAEAATSADQPGSVKKISNGNWQSRLKSCLYPFSNKWINVIIALSGSKGKPRQGEQLQTSHWNPSPPVADQDKHQWL